jgi:hypothetical protein
MFGHAHYVTLMRTKRAELRALRALDPILRARTTPMLECPASVLNGCVSTHAFEARFETFVSHISGWSGRSVFLDLSTISSTGRHPIEIMAARTARAGIRPVLVVTLKTGAESAYTRSTQAVLEHRRDSKPWFRLGADDVGRSGLSCFS